MDVIISFKFSPTSFLFFNIIVEDVQNKTHLIGHGDRDRKWRSHGQEALR